jgi:hypothetical protein
MPGIIIGIIIGLLIAILIFTILAYFRAGMERKMRIVERRLEAAGPQPKAHIFIPEEETAIARKEIIEKNKREGRDTRIDELL